MIKILNLIKKYNYDIALNIEYLELPDTGLIILRGENGSGKTSLLNILSLNDFDFEGTILFNDIDLSKLSYKQQMDFKYRNIAYLYQTNNLISFLDVEENIELISDNLRIRKNNNLVSKLLHKKISELSEGEKAIISIERELMNLKRIILLDEISANLDKNNINLLMEYLREIKSKALIIFVTHDNRELGEFDYELKFKKNNIINENIDISRKKINFNNEHVKTKNIKKRTFKVVFKGLLKTYFAKNVVNIFLTSFFLFLAFGFCCFNETSYYDDIFYESFKSADFFYRDEDIIQKINYNNQEITLQNCNVIKPEKQSEYYYLKAKKCAKVDYNIDETTILMNELIYNSLKEDKKIIDKDTCIIDERLFNYKIDNKIKFLTMSDEALLNNACIEDRTQVLEFKGMWDLNALIDKSYIFNTTVKIGTEDLLKEQYRNLNDNEILITSSEYMRFYSKDSIRLVNFDKYIKNENLTIDYSPLYSVYKDKSVKTLFAKEDIFIRNKNADIVISKNKFEKLKKYKKMIVSSLELNDITKFNPRDYSNPNSRIYGISNNGFRVSSNISYAENVKKINVDSIMYLGIGLGFFIISLTINFIHSFGIVKKNQNNLRNLKNISPFFYTAKLPFLLMHVINDIIVMVFSFIVGSIFPIIFESVFKEVNYFASITVYSLIITLIVLNIANYFILYRVYDDIKMLTNKN